MQEGVAVEFPTPRDTINRLKRIRTGLGTDFLGCTTDGDIRFLNALIEGLDGITDVEVVRVS